MPEVEEATIDEVKQDDLNDDTPTEETVADVIDIIQPKADPRTWTLEFDGEEREYVQEPLKYFNKMQFFALLGETVDLAMQTGLDVSGLLGGRGGFGSRTFTDVNSFVMAFSKVARYAPDLLKESYVLWLNVPVEEREWVKLALEDIDDDMGIEIMETFLDQNFGDLRDFFDKHRKRIIDRAIELNGLSQQSKPLNRTQRRTRKKSKKS